jgi:hypothetical protein
MHEGEFLGPRDVPRVGVDVEDLGTRGYHRAGVLSRRGKLVMERREIGN